MKNKETIVMSIISRFYEDEIDVNKSFNECGINSITFVKIVVAIEQELSFEFDDSDFDDDRFTTIQEFIDYIVADEGLES